MALTLAFDVYGTLIDTHDVVRLLTTMVGPKAVPLSHGWRSKQLEYSFRRGLMQNYVDFALCTRQALDYACQEQGVSLSEPQKQQLLEHYQRLAPFDDVADNLAQLEQAGHRLFAFSNGKGDAVESLLTHAGIRGHFQDVISVNDVKTFKPNPVVYQHFLRRTGASVDQTWLISSNPFDVIGAVSSGWHACWVKRSEQALFDPWEIPPTATIETLGALPWLLDPRGNGAPFPTPSSKT